MEKPCTNCKKKKTLVRDDVSASLVCSSCGIVQEFDNFEAQIGGISGPQGTFVRVGTSGSGTHYNYKEKKLLEAERTINELMLKLGLSGSKPTDIKTMIATITEGEFGLGDWFPVLIGACSYVVMRKEGKTLPIVEVAGVVGCDGYELGRMVTRVIEFLDIRLPEFDVVAAFERAMREWERFSGVGEEAFGRMVKQGVFLVQCAIKWSLTTGRRPMPVVAAVMVLVGELNGVDVGIGEAAREVKAAVATCKLRYKELLEALVKVAQVLPWGKNVTVKNVVKNAPFVIQYMEMKSMAKGRETRKGLESKGFELEDVINECLRKEIEYGNVSGGYDSIEYRDRFQSFGDDDDSVRELKLSHESLSMLYSKFLNEVRYGKCIRGGGQGGGRKRRREYELSGGCNEWWNGKSEMSNKLFLEQILEKDVGLDALPPSFVNGCRAIEKRREKINAAKMRIDKIMYPLNDGDDGNDFCLLECGRAGKKKKQQIDWEDFIIETLLLHQVKEEEIEKGHYNTLLDLYVFNSGVM